MTAEFYIDVWETQAEDVDDFFEEVCGKLQQLNVAKPTLLEAISAREQEHPTGLDFGHMQIALPHADSEHILKSGILLCKNVKPLEFGSMGDKSTKVNVDYIILPLVVDPDEHVHLLGALINSLQEPKVTRLFDNFESVSLRNFLVSRLKKSL